MYIGFIIEYCINDEIVVFYRSLDSIIILIVSSTVLLILIRTTHQLFHYLFINFINNLKKYINCSSNNNVIL